MSKKTRRLWLLISFFAAGALAPLLMRPSQAERERLEANYNQIASMTRTERLRLERNYSDFQALSATDQARFRDLHSRLEADRQDTGLHVEVMDSYYKWLGTLRGDQREVLRKETDPQARREYVEQFVDEQQAPPPEFGDSRWPRLSGEQLDAVFAVIAAKVPFSETQMQQLDAVAELDGSESSASENPLPGGTSANASERRLKRHLLYLQFLIERFRSPDGQAWSFVSNVFQRLHEINVLTELLDAVNDEGLKQQIMENQQVGPGVAFGGMVWWSVLQELEAYRRDHGPTELRLNELFQSLSAAEQDELLALGSQDFRLRLRHMYFEQQVSDLNASQEILQVFRPWRPEGRRGGGFGGPGNNPMGEGRGGNRGPFGNGPGSDRERGDQERGDGNDNTRRDNERDEVRRERRDFNSPPAPTT